jgi:type I restriction enzyme S subunit
LVELGKLIKHRNQSITIDDSVSYRRVTARLQAKGIVLRDEIEGRLLKTKKQQLCKGGDFLVAEIDAKVGGFGIVPDELEGAIVSSHYFLFEINDEQLQRDYLGHYVRTRDFQKQILARGSTNYASIRPEKVLELKLPLPPLSEQKRIVKTMNSLMAKVEEAGKLRWEAAKEAETLVNVEILSLFRKGKESGWKELPLGDYVVDSCYGTSAKANDDPSGTPILRMGNIQNGRLETNNMKYLRLSEKDRKRLILKKGDILVNRTNSAELVGKCAVFDLEGEYAFASYLIRLRFDLTRAEPRLVAWYINSPIGRSYMFKERKQMTGQANVNAKKLRALPIALPSILEQRSVMNRLDFLQNKVDEIRRLQNKTKEEMKGLLPSILNQEFEGRLVEAARPASQ